VANPKIDGDRATYFAAMETYRIAFVAAMLGDTALARRAVDSLPERATISRGEVAGLLAKARGDTANWIASLDAAAKLDAGVVHLGPPNSYPAHELLGDALLAVGRPKDAVTAYEKELELMPNRSRTLLQLARAQRTSGDDAGAAKTEARLRQNWRHADADARERLLSAR
jgi:predicted Zn-dependent protease